MKIRLLREYIALSEILNFTQTATKLYTTQPILTRHIKELEEKFNTKLFIRNTHNVTLTPAGELLLQESKKIVRQYDDSMSIMNNFTGISRDKLSIVYLGDAFFNLLTTFLGQFKEKYPNVNVNYRDSDLLESFNLLRTKEYDIGMVLRPVFVQDLAQEILKEKLNFRTLPLSYDPLCVGLNKKHPLASLENVSLEEISKYPIIVEELKESPWAKLYSTDFLQRQNIPFTVYKEYPNIKTCTVELELNTNVILLLPKHRKFLLGPNSKILEINDTNRYSYIMELVWNAHNINPYVSKFINKLAQSFDDKEIIM